MIHPKMKHIYVGADVHRRNHTAVIIDCFSDKLGEITFENKPSAFGFLLDEVKKHITKGVTPVFGLEDTGGSGRSLAVFLLKQGYTVKHVDASLNYSERRNQSTLVKNDSYDAFCAAKTLLNRLKELPDANPVDSSFALAMLVRRRQAAVKACTAEKNQLHAMLGHNHPGYKGFFGTIDAKAALAFWERYPSPEKLQGVTVDDLGCFLAANSHGILGIDRAAKILDSVKSSGDTTSGYQQSRDFLIAHCVKSIRHMEKEMGELEVEIGRIMATLDYKLHTMIGIELVTAAELISEIGDIERFPTAAKLSMYSGIAPVEYSSGDKSTTLKNRRGNRQLYNIFKGIAARNISPGKGRNNPTNPIFYEYYTKKMSQGKTHSQALIAVMRRLCNIIYGLMKNKTEYIHPKLNKKENQ